MSSERPARQADAAPDATAGEPVSPPRPLSKNARLALAGLFLLAAIGTRFWHLGDRPLHHDESIHAFQSYTLSKDGNWRYDPAYHGPFLYYANALVYKIAGASNTTARILPALFGLALIGFAWPLSRWIGRPAAIAYALLVLLSPHLTYFSRFIREDLYSLVFTLATIVCFRRFLETDRAGWLNLAAVSFALAGVTKENAYMTGVLFVVFGIWTLIERTIAGKPHGAALAAAIRDGVRWTKARFTLLFTAGLIFLFIWALMYTGFGRYPGDWLAIPKAVRYWMGQHSIARIPGPWYYYFPQIVYYETGLVAALLFAFSDRRRDPFFRFLIFWAIGSLAIYAWAREKVPWLTVHPLLPLTILAGIGLANLWENRRKRPFSVSLVAVLLAVNTAGMILACFRYGAYDTERRPKNGEYLAYVQTTEDLVRALRAVDVAKARVPPGQPVITVTGEASWPLTWYLRDTPTTWTTRITEASTPIIVADWNPESGLEKQLADRYDAKRVPIRAWWFPERHPASPPENPVARPTAGDAVRWWLFHELWSPIGSQDATFYVRKDLSGGGPLEPLQIPVQDVTAREYRDPADPVAPDRTFGEPGSGPGQLSEPRGLATDGHGNVYVADTKNHRIQVFDGTGRFLRSMGAKGNADGQLNEPNGVAVDENGDVWVADTWNNRIVQFGADGRFVKAFADPDKALFGPRGIVVSRGTVYVTDTGNKRVIRFDRQGRHIGDWGSDGNHPGQFVEPVGIAADAAGRIAIADTGNHRVQVFDAEGKFLREFRVNGWKDFYTEPHLVVGPSDAVLVTDSWGARCASYDANGNFTRSWAADGLRSPTGIALDAFGRLYVTDRAVNRVVVWSLTNVIR